jgi:asparagine synthase (glutamine-hydrolysing)
MCGISGYYNPKLKVNHLQKLEAMAQMQGHRGPDHTGYFNNDHLGFAHNRLSLLDLSELGNQPFKCEKGVLIYNGEIYNYKELETELDNWDKRSSSDTEVLFQCLIQWGVEKTLSRIEGMFAFAFFDRETKDLYLCRDRFGIKPLFYGQSGDGDFFFASEIKALSQVWHCEVDAIQVLFSSLSVLEKSNYRTAWKNIMIVPCGSYVRINQEGIKTEEYFNVTDYINERDYQHRYKSSWSNILEEFSSLMEASVNKMLVADAEMGAYVSGGIDSSLIAYYANKNKGNGFKLFTANVLGKHSEFQDAQYLAKSLNMHLYDYPFEKEMTFRDWAKVTWHYETPIVNHFNAIPFSNVSKLAYEHNVKAVLTGEGSDELFLGYPRLLTRRYDNLIRSPYNLLNSLYKRHSKLANYIDSSRGSGGLLGVFELAVQGFHRQIKKHEQINRYDFVSKVEQNDQYMSAQMMQEGIRSLLWRNDRMGMIYSIESRFPFLDEDIVKFAMNLPVKFKIGRTNKFYNYKHPFLMDKAIVRKLAEDKLPKSLVYKRKNGFPLHGLREVNVKPEFLYNSVFSELFSLRNNEIDHFVRHSSQYHVALIASFEIWAKLFVRKDSLDVTEKEINKYLRF